MPPRKKSQQSVFSLHSNGTFNVIKLNKYNSNGMFYYVVFIWPKLWCSYPTGVVHLTSDRMQLQWMLLWDCKMILIINDIHYDKYTLGGTLLLLKIIIINILISVYFNKVNESVIFSVFLCKKILTKLINISIALIMTALISCLL